jgi:hypothetical protein
MNEVITDAAKEAAGTLKKIRAAKGKLKGNFYFAGDTRGKEAGLVVTLQARDPKGSKATTQGKAIRKEIKGAKFAQGIVSVDGSALLFELYAGTASKDHVKLGFKKSLSELPGLGILKKALLKKGGDKTDTADVADESAPETPPVPEVTEALSDLDEAELKELMAAQETLGNLNDELMDFLSDDNTEAERGEQLAEQLTELASLTSAEPRDEAAISAARRALAELAYTGSDPFPEVGAPLTAEARALLSGAIDGAVAALSRYLTRAIEEIGEIHATVSSSAPTEIPEPERQRMLKSLDLSAAAVTSLREQLRTNLVAEASDGRSRS